MQASLTLLVTAIGTHSAESVFKLLRKAFPGCILIGTDLNPMESIPNSNLVDRFCRVPPATSPDYAVEMHRICRKEQIQYLIPLTDPEVDAFIGLGEWFDSIGTVITQSSDVSVRLSRDKFQWYRFFSGHRSVNVIPTWLASDITAESPFPLLAKKRNGRSSEGMIRYEDFKQWATCRERTSDHIIQPFWDGDIHTVDVVRSENGDVKALARHEIERNPRGLGLRVEVQKDSDSAHLAALVASELNLIGAINIEFLVKEGIPYLMDVNPRVSGGVRFSIDAGFDVIEEHMGVFESHGIHQGAQKMVRFITSLKCA